MAQIVIKKWPFREGESASLYWLRSPFQAGEGQHWIMTAVFKGEDGDLKDVTVPWGMLPTLRLGGIYCDGKWTGESSPMEKRRILFGSCAKLSIIDSLSVPVDLYKLKTRWNLQEKCCAIWNGRERFIVPCLEVIRAYFALNRLLTTEILKPDSFNGICTSIMKDQQVHLSFSNRVPAQALNSEVVKRIALILEEKSFGVAWRKVWASASLEARRGMNIRRFSAPVICEPPAFNGSNWEVAGVGNGKTFMIQEIISLTFRTRCPFTSVTYEHPSFLRFEDGSIRHGGIGTQEDSDEIVIGSMPSPPRSLTNPLTVETKSCVIGFLFPVQIEKISKKATETSNACNFHGGGTMLRKLVPRQEGTLNEEAGVGELPAVEFRPFKSFADIQPAFHKLFKALAHKPDVINLFYQLASAPDRCRLPRYGSGPRAYVLVCLSILGKLVYLLEVDNSDGHTLSTVIFVASEGQAASECALKILREGVAAGGHWDKNRLQNILGLSRHYLAKHSRSTAQNWGKRLYCTAQGFLSCSN